MYIDQLSGAAHTSKLFEILFFTVFNLQLIRSISQFVMASLPREVARFFDSSTIQNTGLFYLNNGHKHLSALSDMSIIQMPGIQMPAIRILPVFRSPSLVR